MRHWWSRKKYELLREAHACPWLCDFPTQWPCHEDDLIHMTCSSGLIWSFSSKKKCMDTLHTYILRLG